MNQRSRAKSYRFCFCCGRYDHVELQRRPDSSRQVGVGDHPERLATRPEASRNAAAGGFAVRRGTDGCYDRKDR
jgi:hypothetical protein